LVDCGSNCPRIHPFFYVIIVIAICPTASALHFGIIHLSLSGQLSNRHSRVINLSRNNVRVGGQGNGLGGEFVHNVMKDRECHSIPTLPLSIVVSLLLVDTRKLRRNGCSETAKSSLADVDGTNSQASFHSRLRKFQSFWKRTPEILAPVSM